MPPPSTSSSINSSRPPVPRSSPTSHVEVSDSRSQKPVIQSIQPNRRHQCQADQYRMVTWSLRASVVVAVGLLLLFKPSIQSTVDDLWEYLKNHPAFYSAYFETVYVTIMYAVIIACHPFAVHFVPFLQRFKVSEDVTYIHRTLLGWDGLVAESLAYLGTYALADAVKMKKYQNVPEEEWEKRRGQWIQTTRALPQHSPDVVVMCLHVVAALVLFDAAFFFIHLALHKSRLLYKYIHACHHDHDVMHPHVTNQLSMVERILQVASANYSLLFLGAHPLTRVVFVPCYIWVLVDNHTGYDLPWAPHRLAPHGWMGGPAKHHDHHLRGTRNYQPIFNYLDNWWNWRAKRRTRSD